VAEDILELERIASHFSRKPNGGAMNESIGSPTGGEGYSGEPPEFFNYAEDVVGMWARDDPKKIALIWIDDDGKQSTWTFQELDRASSKLAYVLDQRGFKRGDRVIIQMRDDQPWWYITALAAMKTGGVFIIMSIGWTPSSRFSSEMVESDIGFAIRLAKPRVVISDMANSGTIPGEGELLIYDEAEFSSELEKAPTEFRSVRSKISEPCYARLTSGTTGSAPKMVLLSHAALFYRHYKDGISKDDLNWLLVPARAPIWAGIWRAGMPIFLRRSASQSPATLISETLCNYPITHLRAGSRVFDDLASIGFGDCTYKTLRKGMCVGSHANLKPETRKAWIDKLGITITGGYGQSELGPGAFLRGEKSGSGSLGKPSPLYDLAVIDEQGRELCPNELVQRVKRLRIRSLSVSMAPPCRNPFCRTSSSWQKVFHAKVTVLRSFSLKQIMFSFEDYHPDLDELKGELRWEAMSYLDEKVAELKSRGLVDVFRSVTEGDAAETIIETAKGVPNTLIAMSPHSGSVIKHWVLGSVTEKVLRHANNSVLMIRT
jgi:nucleotide-binding universal stress UspA family protein